MRERETNIHSILKISLEKSVTSFKNMTGLSQKSIPDITSFIIITHEEKKEDTTD